MAKGAPTGCFIGAPSAGVGAVGPLRFGAVHESRKLDSLDVPWRRLRHTKLVQEPTNTHRREGVLLSADGFEDGAAQDRPADDREAFCRARSEVPRPRPAPPRNDQAGPRPR